ncbi:efflux RND transporter periplasmic adaptor subunit [Rhizobium terrae]|uniref:efflux RND transporter periplasmic adaptor subunit n=1 Tax=Rhizobium terrae TaxID=2171756 RepID=UPI001D005B2F|nr:efflux RND transporter periplasmic adaptor subunit [Rhizobium terrae]
MINEHDRKFAETLKSLALEPPSQPSGHKTKRTRFIFLALFLVLLGLAATVTVRAFRPDILDRWATVPAPPREAEAAASKATAEKTAESKPSPMPAKEVAGSGYVIALQAVPVFSWYEGRITSVEVDVGQRVRKGDVLVMLDDVSARFALEKAQAERVSAGLTLDSRSIELDQSTALLRRAEGLAMKQVVSRQELEDAVTARDKAANAVAQARQQLAKADLEIRVAEERVDALIVKAPFSGTITQLNARAGGTVLSRLDSVRENESLLTLTDTNNLVIDADVAETNLAALRAGLHGKAVLDAFPDQPFTIEILRLGPVVSTEKGTISLRLSLIDPPKDVRPNMAARIQIPVQTGDARQ